MMLDLTQPLLVDECRLDLFVEGPDGKPIRPVITVLLSKRPLGHAGHLAHALPYRSVAKGTIESAFLGLSHAVKLMLENQK